MDLALRGAGALTGVPLATIANEVRGLDKLSLGDAKEGVALMLGYSPYVIETKILGD